MRFETSCRPGPWKCAGNIPQSTSSPTPFLLGRWWGRDAGDRLEHPLHLFPSTHLEGSRRGEEHAGGPCWVPSWPCLECMSGWLCSETECSMQLPTLTRTWAGSRGVSVSPTQAWRVGGGRLKNMCMLLLGVCTCILLPTFLISTGATEAPMPLTQDGEGRGQRLQQANRLADRRTQATYRNEPRLSSMHQRAPPWHASSG